MNINDLQQKAESGSIPAKSILGICYLDGLDVDIDYAKAFQLLSEAAANGASRAIVNLARMYAQGLGVPADIREAIRLYESVGNFEFLAAIELGRIYSRSLGVASDRSKAAHWYGIAVSQQSTVVDCDELREAKAYLAGKS
ncbi:MAG TPA: tetratricopeptide repeat protein [Terriglobales bacterium]|jgi:TPR repeat protein|nr:tetratricopeptide repeat protein [Terriglobales bacterium]